MTNDAIVAVGTRVTVLAGFGGKSGNYFRRPSVDVSGTVVEGSAIGGNVWVKTDDDKRQWEFPKRGLVELA
jgi:hypothetical protein